MQGFYLALRSLARVPARFIVEVQMQASQEVFCLLDDEAFAPRDREAQRLVYGRVHAEQPPLLALSQQEVKHISCINFTGAHFAVEGATRFSDLKPEAFRLFCSLMNALGHATDKKKNPRQPVVGTATVSPPAPSLTASSTAISNSGEKPSRKRKSKSGKRRKQTRDSELEAAEESTDDMDDPAAQQEAATDPNERMGGDEHLSLYIETLFDEVWRVAGFRLWIFDAAVHKTRIDLLTRGMRESLTECSLLQKQIQTKMEQFQRSLGTGQNKRPQAQRTCEVTPRYQFAQYADEDLYTLLAREYFLGDTLACGAHAQRMPQSVLDRLMDNDDDDNAEAHGGDEDAQLARQAKPGFTDTRPFMTGAAPPPQSLRQSAVRPRFEMPGFFGKEQAMVYHVEAGNVQAEQRLLQRYFAPYSKRVAQELEKRQALEEEGRQKATRLEQLMKEKLDEKNFVHFPFANTTYRVDPSCLSLEVMSEMPLPHRLGCVPYTQGQRHETQRRIREQRQHGGGEDDEATALFGERAPEGSDDQLDERIARRPLGLHDTELEVTPGVLHQHFEQLGDELRRYLTARNIPRHLSQAFLGQIRNTVQRELQTMQGLVRQPKSDLVEQRQAGLPVAATGRTQQYQLYKATTAAGVINNRHKQHLLDRRIGREVGLSSEARDRERETMLARASLAFYRPQLGRWRPTHATLDNVKKQCTTLLHDESFMQRDYALMLHCVNALGHSRILEKHTDPKTGQIREGQWEQYQRDKREFIEAALVEFWEEFFTSRHVSIAGKGIREDLKLSGKNGHVGREMPVHTFDVQARPYHLYKQQLYAYFGDHGALTNQYKTMSNVWHGKYHHCRFYQPGCKDPKLAMIMGGNGDVGKSYRLNIVKESCPSGVCEGITYISPQAFNTDMNWNDLLMINEEMSNKLVGPSDLKGESQLDDSRNHAKERMTAHQTTTLAFYFDDETGDRKAKLSKCQCQCNILGATNIDMANMDPNVASRFIIFSVPASVDESEGNAAHHKEKQCAGRDPAITNELVEQKREEHRVYFMMEQLIKSGVLGDAVFGAEVDGARILINKVLDRLQSEYRVPTNKPRKRKHVLEMARVLCIANAVWYVLTSPLERHLQLDPQTQEFIGLNPRVLLAIADRLVVTTDHVVDALTMLSTLWTHDYQDAILENFALSQCKLDELREQDFVHRAPGNGLQRDALETAPLAYSARQARTNRNPTPAWSMYAQQQQPGQPGQPLAPVQEEWEIDYNYISLSAKSYDEIYQRLSTTSNTLRISTQDIHRMLKELSNNKIDCDAYVMKQTQQPDGKMQRRLVRCTDKSRYRSRKIVDFGHDASEFKTVAISVAFLKQKLPHRLRDSVIQNLSVVDPPNDEDAQRDEVAGEEAAEGVMELDTGCGVDPERQLMDLQQRLESALRIDPGDANETTVIRAIRDVLECSVLGWTGECSVDEEAELDAEYGDVITGESPCSVYVTSEHPPALSAESVFGDLMPANQHVDKHGAGELPREISMVDKPAVIRLRRNARAPLVVYNHMTISPLARASLSVYQQEHGMDAGGIREDDATDEPEWQTTQRHRFMLHAKTATFCFDKDPDYTYCEAHLRNMACPQPRVQGRLINYPPHVYMSLIDWRDERERETGKRREFVQPYADVMHKVVTTRQMLNARRGNLSEALPMTRFLASDCSESDLAAQQTNEPVRRRQPASRAATQRSHALKSLQASGAQVLGAALTRTPKSTKKVAKKTL